MSHILSSRGIDDDIVRLEKLRIAMEERPDEQTIARFTKAQDAFEVKGGYAANSEARAIAAGLGLKADRLAAREARLPPHAGPLVEKAGGVVGVEQQVGVRYDHGVLPARV